MESDISEFMPTAPRSFVESKSVSSISISEHIMLWIIAERLLISEGERGVLDDTGVEIPVLLVDVLNSELRVELLFIADTPQVFDDLNCLRCSFNALTVG